MKALSETLKENGTAFTVSIEIKDADDNQTYYENSDGVKRGTPKSQSCEKVTVNSRFHEPRHFYLIDNDWFYDVCGDSVVGKSCAPDGSLGHVDPSGGPFVGVDTNLSDIHKDLPDACVTKIERDTDRDLFKLSV